MATEVEQFVVSGNGPMKLLWERDGKAITFWAINASDPEGPEWLL